MEEEQKISRSLQRDVAFLLHSIVNDIANGSCDRLWEKQQHDHISELLESDTIIHFIHKKSE